MLALASQHVVLTRQPMFRLNTVTRASIQSITSSYDADESEYLEDLEAQLRSVAAGRAPSSFTGRQNSLFWQLQRRAKSREQARQRTASTDRTRNSLSRLRPVITRESTQLNNLPGTLQALYKFYLESPGQPFLLGALALLIGFYLAGSLSTIFGAKGFWEPVIALGPLLVTERVSREYYTRSSKERSQTLKLLNAMKNGFYLGIVIDALKLAG